MATARPMSVPVKRTFEESVLQREVVGCGPYTNPDTGLASHASASERTGSDHDRPSTNLGDFRDD